MDNALNEMIEGLRPEIEANRKEILHHLEFSQIKEGNDVGPALYVAVMRRNVEAVATLLGWGADPNLNFIGRPVLINAVHNTDYGDYSPAAGEIVGLLLQYGARANCRDYLSLTPLHYVMSEGSDESPDSMEALKLLLVYGADFKQRTTLGFTPEKMGQESDKPNDKLMALLQGHMRHKRGQGAAAVIDKFLKTADILIEPVTPVQAKLASEAYERFSALNFGDAFAYALAKERGVALLFIGKDFEATDIESAL